MAYLPLGVLVGLADGGELDQLVPVHHLLHRQTDSRDAHHRHHVPHRFHGRGVQQSDVLLLHVPGERVLHLHRPGPVRHHLGHPRGPGTLPDAEADLHGSDQPVRLSDRAGHGKDSRGRHGRHHHPGIRYAGPWFAVGTTEHRLGICWRWH